MDDLETVRQWLKGLSTHCRAMLHSEFGYELTDGVKRYWTPNDRRFLERLKRDRDRVAEWHRTYKERFRQAFDRQRTKDLIRHQSMNP